MPRGTEFLWEPWRYKCLYGGRGSGKSHTVAGVLAIMGVVKHGGKRILCAREYQNSLAESVHHLLTYKIQQYGLEQYYQINESSIMSRFGSEFIFAGLRKKINSLRSFEDIDIVWIEEGQFVSKDVADVLFPTIRKPGSEIWCTMNPDLEDDELYQRFVVDPPENCKSLMLNWQENPFFEDSPMAAERLDCLKRDPEGYENIWEGKCRQSVSGAIYRAELQALEDQGRITSVPYDPMMPVNTAWDLGMRSVHHMPLWFFQESPGGDIRIIDFAEMGGVGMPECAQFLQSKGYVYGRHIAPPDIQVREIGTGKSRFDVAMNHGIRFSPLGKQNIEDGIHTVKMMFPRMWFDKDRTKAGRKHLARYRRAEKSQIGELTAAIVEDNAAHCADALRYLCQGHKEYMPERKPINRNRYREGWME